MLLALLGAAACKEVAWVHAEQQFAASDASAARELDAGTQLVRPFRGTFGTISDGVSGEALQGASVRFVSKDPGAESEGFVQPDFAVVSVTQPKGYYSYEGGFPEGIAKVQVEAEGYEPLLAYVSHLHTEQCAGGPCSRHDFALWPTGHPHALLPDLVPNSSYIHSSRIELTNECDGREGVVTCLRAPVGVANMARGELFISAPGDLPKQVSQHISNTDGTTTSRLLQAEFGEDATRQAIVFPSWVRLALRKIDASCATRTNAEACPIVRESLRGTSCMRDYVLVEPSFEADRRYDCVVSDDGYIEQGIGPGQMDVSDIALADQFIDVTGLPNGEYWLEVSVNPNHVVQEADYNNNTGRARFQLDLPECGNAVQEPPESCDGDDLNDTTCRSLDDRYAGGTLRCSEHCGFDRSDCQLALCAPIDIGSALGRVAQGNLAAARNTTAPLECALTAASGRDVAFSWTAPETGPYSITDKLEAMFISVREESCDGRELACVTDASWAGLAIDLQKGQRIVIVIDAYPGADRYDLQIISLK